MIPTSIKNIGRINIFFLVLILLFTLLSAFWQIGTIPPSAVNTFLSERIISACLGVFLVGICMLWVKSVFRKTSLAVLSGFILVTQPWFVQEIRIFSPFLYASCALTILSFSIQRIRSSTIRKLATFCFVGVIAILSFLLVPGNFRIPISVVDGKLLLQNFFSLLSFEKLFIKNQSFWSGEASDVGIFLPVLFPFLIIGILGYPWRKGIFTLLFCWVVIVSLVAALSATFPEERVFFLALIPLLIYAIGGIKRAFSWNWLPARSILFLGFSLIYGYSYLYFLHLYLFHNSLKVLQYLEKLYVHF